MARKTKAQVALDVDTPIKISAEFVKTTKTKHRYDFNQHGIQGSLYLEIELHEEAPDELLLEILAGE